MRKVKINKLERPLVHMNAWWILGIIGGNMFLLEEHIPLFFLSAIGIALIIFYGYHYGVNTGIYVLVSLTISMMLFLQNPLQYEIQDIRQIETGEIHGKIKEINQTKYYKYITLQDATFTSEEETRLLKTNLQIRTNNNSEFTTNDEVKIKAEFLQGEPQMNPSDFNYLTYLKGKNISGSFKMTSLLNYNKKDPIYEKVLVLLKGKIEELYEDKYRGIMEASLLGDDSKIDAETESLYNKSGIGHVLCISGFHIGLMMALLMTVLSFIGLPYAIRFILVIMGIWGYALMTGSSVSTIRAACMLTIMLIGRCLWQEEDALNSLSLASLSILFFLPYQLFQVGFQLSFMAVLSIIMVSNEMEKKERTGEENYTRWQKNLLVTGAVQLAVAPIIAYYFYEVPLLISVMNLLVIPIFSLVIIIGWLSLVLYMLHIPIAPMLAGGVERVLGLIQSVMNGLIKLPLATLCTGRPKIWEFILFVVVVALLAGYYFKYLKPSSFYKGIFMTCLAWGIIYYFTPKCLNISMLYVGQGDSIVIETPQHEMVVIDGGNFGKGQVVADYIKYKGKKTIEALIVSHSDADHIGGLIELMGTDVVIKKAFISAADQSDLLDQFLKQCKTNRVKVYELKQKDMIRLENIVITCLAPVSRCYYSESNNNSIVCLLQYNHFKALFTGDKEKNSDMDIYDTVGPISLLKLSHHGSRTGTSKDLLLKLNPRYAMMSCGRNNRYGHPHEEVLELIDEFQIPMSRTDKNGATWYETDGYYLKETKYRKDD